MMRGGQEARLLKLFLNIMPKNGKKYSKDKRVN